MTFTNGGGFVQAGATGAGSVGPTGPTGPTGPAGTADPTLSQHGRASGAAAAVNITSATYANLPGVQATVVAIDEPTTDVLTVSFTVQVGSNAAAAVGDFVAFAIDIVNTTASTHPLAASDDRAAVFTAPIAGVNAAGLTISRTIVVAGLGVPGDSLQVAIFARTNHSGAFFVWRTDLVTIPSP